MKPRRGFALPVALVVLIVLGVLSMAAVNVSSDSMRSGKAVREASLALFAAEAGLRSTVGNWPTVAVAALNPGDSLDLGWQNLTNRATYRAVITEVDGGGLQSYVVVVQGRGKGASTQAGQRTVLAMATGVPTFRYGIFAKANMTYSGGSGTDSYDSSVGAYNPLVHDSLGSIAAVGTITLSSGSTSILGDATTQSTISNSGAVITGVATQNAPPFPVINAPACPAGAYTPLAAFPSPLPNHVNYDEGTGVLNISGGGTVALGVPPTQYYFSQIVLSGGSTVTLNNAVAQHVDIYINDKLDVSGGGIVNGTSNPRTLSILGCGAGTRSWSLSGGSGAYFAVLAPGHDITISGAGDLWGAIVGQNVTATGGSHLHYDESLANARSAVFAMVPRSWTELTLY